MTLLYTCNQNGSIRCYDPIDHDLCFEKEFVEVCRSTLDETLKLLSCDLPHSIFLVGIDVRANTVTVLPNDALIAEDQLEEVIDFPRDVYAPYPEDNDLPEAQWNALFKAHDESCWEYWRRLRDAVEEILAGTDHASTVSPCCEVNGFLVAIVATYSKTAYEHYPSLDMKVFIEQGRSPSFLFGAIEAILDKFADELRKRDAGGRYENDPPNARNILRSAGAFFTRVHAWAGKRFSPLDIQLRRYVGLVRRLQRDIGPSLRKSRRAWRHDHCRRAAPCNCHGNVPQSAANGD